jgi:hypothetical protein
MLSWASLDPSNVVSETRILDEDLFRVLSEISCTRWNDSNFGVGSKNLSVVLHTLCSFAATENRLLGWLGKVFQSSFDCWPLLSTDCSNTLPNSLCSSSGNERNSVHQLQ